MLEVRRVRPGDWEALREVRVAALADAPTAFGTTHAEALERPDDWWRDWAVRSAEGGSQAMFLAWEGDRAVGIAGAFFDDPSWRVISMWVDPAQRGSGAGRALLDAIAEFARAEGTDHLILDVTDGNDAARVLYERYGFVDTGKSEPLRSHPELHTRELRLEL